MSQIVDVHALPTDRPLLLLDVDGVFNVINDSQNTKRYDIFMAMDLYKIRLAKVLAGYMEELVEHFIPVWCTTWDEDANEYFAERLRMPYLPVIPTREARSSELTHAELDPIANVHWKTPAIVKYIKTRPYAWVDDELGQGDQDYAAMRTALVAPTLMMKTREREGLLRHHVDKLITWAELIKQP